MFTGPYLPVVDHRRLTTLQVGWFVFLNLATITDISMDPGWLWMLMASIPLMFTYLATLA